KRQDGVGAGRDCDAPAENLEQHPDASGIVELLQYRQLLGEWARHQTHRFADLQLGGELQNAAGVGCRDQHLDDAGRHRMRFSTPQHQPRHPKGAVDAAPPVAGEIEDDEEIAGKKRRLDRAQFARVSNRLMPFWLKGPEALAIELSFCARFGKWQSVYGVPPLAVAKSAPWDLYRPGGLPRSFDLGEPSVRGRPYDPMVRRRAIIGRQLAVAGGAGVCPHHDNAIQPDAAQPEKSDRS